MCYLHEKYDFSFMLERTTLPPCILELRKSDILLPQVAKLNFTCCNIKLHVLYITVEPAIIISLKRSQKRNASDSRFCLKRGYSHRLSNVHFPPQVQLFSSSTLKIILYCHKCCICSFRQTLSILIDRLYAKTVYFISVWQITKDKANVD